MVPLPVEPSPVVLSPVVPLRVVSLAGVPPCVSTRIDGTNFQMEEAVERLVVRLLL